MSRFALLVLALQACLLQNVYSQCIGAGRPAAAIGAPCGCGAELVGPLGLGIGPAVGPIGLGIGGPLGLGIGLASVGPLGLGIASPAGLGLAGVGPAYGGVGVGEVAVAGELGVSGATALAGQVPILGAVEFFGLVPAGGTVSIAGSCGCGCNGLAGPRIHNYIDWLGVWGQLFQFRTSRGH